MKKNLQAFKLFLPIGVASTALALMSYVAVQQDLRQSANDPQIQMAEDAAIAMQQGATADTAIGTTRVSAKTGLLAPFITITDDHYKVLATSLQGGSKDFVPPAGAFEYAKTNGEDRITWQPDSLTRLAAVIVPYKTSQQSGFVMTARSLKEVEKRENQLTNTIALGWVVLMVLTFIFTLIIV